MFNYVYVLENDKRELYIGYTENIKRRLAEHNYGSNKSTSIGRPWKLVFFEGYRNRFDAIRREKYLKTSQGARFIKRMLKEYFYEERRK